MGAIFQTASVEVYNPSTGTFTPADSMLAGRAGQTATCSGTDAVLLAGGYSLRRNRGAIGLFASAEIYTPSGGSLLVLVPRVP